MPHQEWKDGRGRPLPSVTQVLSLYQPEDLVRWRGAKGNREADRVMHEAGDFGSRMHGLIEEAFARGTPVEGEEDDLAARLAAQAYQWAKDEGVVVVAQEEGILNEVDGYGGTADLFCRFHADPTLWVADWKSSSSVHETYDLQLAAYARAYNLKHGLTWATGVNNGIIIRPQKKAPHKPPQIVRVPNLEREFTAFDGLLTLWKKLNRRGQWEC